MIHFGIEKETTELDNSGSTLTIIKKIHEGEVAKMFKTFSVRVKVRDSKEEMAEYLRYTDSIKEKKQDGLLVMKEGSDYMPSFAIEYPKFDTDGSYFVIKSWSEYIK